ncbi:MAG: hypothetical protein HQL51_00610 [Magnetococcales bacterium]|nr:hypothetical protein [Magnetococcales bacterium]
MSIPPHSSQPHWESGAVIFDQSLIQQILDLWRSKDEDEPSDPDVEKIRLIMETVFLASLKREEDRSLRLSVTLAPPEFFPAETRAGEHVVLHFASPQPFTVDGLVKLSPAFDPGTTALAVRPSVSGDDPLEIWGAIFTTHRGGNRFDPLPLRLSPPDVLTISSMQPGSLSVFRAGNIIARFNAGRFFEPTPTPFTSSLMGWSLLKTIKEHHGFKRFGTHYWRVYRDLIDRMLIEVNHRGHGGTIIWFDEERSPDALRWIVPKHHLRRGPEAASLVEHLCALELQREDGGTSPSSITADNCARAVEEGILECKRQLVEHVELLAQLTHVDGALILNDELKPLSFGSMLVAPAWRGKTIYGPDNAAYPSIQVDLAHYGTRHNSAVHFVGKATGSVAFVISQDGPISGLTLKDDETVYWWPDCLSKLWVV